MSLVYEFRDTLAAQNTEREVKRGTKKRRGCGELREVEGTVEPRERERREGMLTKSLRYCCLMKRAEVEGLAPTTPRKGQEGEGRGSRVEEKGRSTCTEESL